MDEQRRERFLTWFEANYTAKGKKRADFMQDTARNGDEPLTKGRVSQLFNPQEPFGEDAARALAARLKEPEDIFLRDHAELSEMARALGQEFDTTVPEAIRHPVYSALIAQIGALVAASRHAKSPPAEPPKVVPQRASRTPHA